MSIETRYKKFAEFIVILADIVRKRISSDWTGEIRIIIKFFNGGITRIRKSIEDDIK